jgi:hypothetical protein
MDGGQDTTLPVQETTDIKHESRERPPGRRWPCFVFPLLAYGALAVVLTWPMMAHFATHVPGDGIDDPSLAWNLWWAKHAFLDQLQNPFSVGWQFWPVGINLAFYTLTILNGLLGIPLQLAFGLIPTYNLLLLSSFAIGGFGAYLLCLDTLGAVGKERVRRGDRQTPRQVDTPTRRWPTALPLAAFLGGALYAFASSKMFYAALGQGNIASSQWIPFTVLYIVRSARPAGKAHDATLAALFLALQAYAELTYASFLLIFAGLAALWGLARVLRHKASGAWFLIGRFLLIALLFLAPKGISSRPVVAFLICSRLTWRVMPCRLSCTLYWVMSSARWPTTRRPGLMAATSRSRRASRSTSGMWPSRWR